MYKNVNNKRFGKREIEPLKQLKKRFGSNCILTINNYDLFHCWFSIKTVKIIFRNRPWVGPRIPGERKERRVRPKAGSTAAGADDAAAADEIAEVRSVSETIHHLNW